MTHRQKKFLLFLAIIPLLGGAVLFFPVKLDNRYTCLYHRIAESGNPVHHEGSKPLDGRLLTGNHNMPHSMMMESYYMERFVFIWWLSLLLTFLAIRKILKIETPQKNYTEEKLNDETSY